MGYLDLNSRLTGGPRRKKRVFLDTSESEDKGSYFEDDEEALTFRLQRIGPEGKETPVKIYIIEKPTWYFKGVLVMESIRDGVQMARLKKYKDGQPVEAEYNYAYIPPGRDPQISLRVAENSQAIAQLTARVEDLEAICEPSCANTGETTTSSFTTVEGEEGEDDGSSAARE